LAEFLLLERLVQFPLAAMWAAVPESGAVESAAAQVAAVVAAQAVAQDPDAPWPAVEPAQAALR
jgi:hypothetical protein